MDSGHEPEPTNSFSDQKSDQKNLIMADVMQHWIDQLTLVPQREKWPNFESMRPNRFVGPDKRLVLPPKVEFIACQLGMCVIVKCGMDTNYCSS